MFYITCYASSSFLIPDIPLFLYFFHKIKVCQYRTCACLTSLFRFPQQEISTCCVTQLNPITIATPKTKVIGSHLNTCEPVINNNSMNIGNLELSHITCEHHGCAIEKRANNTLKIMNMLKQYNTVRCDNTINR